MTIKQILELVQSHSEFQLEVRNNIEVHDLYDVMHELRSKLECVSLMEISAVDFPKRKYRFRVTYCLLDIQNNARIFINIDIQEGESIKSIFDIFKSALWSEREMFDMFGIEFNGNEGSRRILSHYKISENYFPLRKDFPLSGKTEIQYNPGLDKIEEVKVNLPQEYRNFDFISPWSVKCD